MKIKSLLLYVTAFCCGTSFLLAQEKEGPDRRSGQSSENSSQISDLITTSDYVAFLNERANTDIKGLYEAKIAPGLTTPSMARSGTPENYLYEVMPGKENTPMFFLSWDDAASYCEWLAPSRDVSLIAYSSCGQTVEGLDHSLKSNCLMFRLVRADGAAHEASLTGAAAAGALEAALEDIYIVGAMAAGAGSVARDNESFVETSSASLEVAADRAKATDLTRKALLRADAGRLQHECAKEEVLALEVEKIYQERLRLQTTLQGGSFLGANKQRLLEIDTKDQRLATHQQELKRLWQKITNLVQGKTSTAFCVTTKATEPSGDRAETSETASSDTVDAEVTSYQKNAQLQLKKINLRRTQHALYLDHIKWEVELSHLHFWNRNTAFELNGKIADCYTTMERLKTQIDSLSRLIQPAEKIIKPAAEIEAEARVKSNYRLDNQARRDALMNELMTIYVFTKTELLKSSDKHSVYKNSKAFAQEHEGKRRLFGSVEQIYTQQIQKSAEKANSKQSLSYLDHDIKQFRSMPPIARALQFIKTKERWTTALGELHEAYWKRQEALRNIGIVKREGYCLDEEEGQCVLSQDMEGLETLANYANALALEVAEKIEILRRVPGLSPEEVRTVRARIETLTSKQKEAEIFRIVQSKGATITEEEKNYEATLSFEERCERGNQELYQAIRELQEAKSQRDVALASLQYGRWYNEDFGKLVELTDPLMIKQRAEQANLEVIKAAKRLENIQRSMLSSEDWKLEVSRIAALTLAEREGELLKKNIEEKDLALAQAGKNDPFNWSLKTIAALAEVNRTWEDFEKNNPLGSSRNAANEARWDQEERDRRMKQRDEENRRRLEQQEEANRKRQNQQNALRVLTIVAKLIT